MTIDDLKARRDTLRAQKAHEEELLAAGEGDNMALFIIEEELLEVNAQIRSLTSSRRRIGSRTVSADSMGGKMQEDQMLYRAWEQMQETPDTNTREVLLRTLENSRSYLTERQYLYLSMWAQGRTMDVIAKWHGVSRSTVSRVITRGKNRLRAVAEAAEPVASVGARKIDMSDPDISAKILKAVTPKQAVYIYLYYGEWLTLREIAELLGLKSHQTVMVSIRAGLRNIGRVFGYNALELQNMESLDQLAYSIYQTLDTEQLLPQDEKKHVQEKLKSHRRPIIHRSEMPNIILHRGSGVVSVRWPYWHRPAVPTRGKLLKELLNRKLAMQTTGRSIGAWLSYIFQKLAKNLGGKIRHELGGA